MARAYGSSAHMLMKRETAYGQAATGNHIRMPFNRCNLGSEQGLIDDPVLGQARDPLAPLQDGCADTGQASCPSPLHGAGAIAVGRRMTDVRLGEHARATPADRMVARQPGRSLTRA